MNKLNKILTIIMIILFPLGIIYCIGKNLFNGNFASFLGGWFLFGLGFVFCIILLRPDISEPVFEFFRSIKGVLL